MYVCVRACLLAGGFVCEVVTVMVMLMVAGLAVMLLVVVTVVVTVVVSRVMVTDMRCRGMSISPG